MNSEDFVVCPICGKQFKHINNMHAAKHNTTVEEIKIKYPECRLISQTSSKKRSEANRNEMLNIHHNSSDEYLKRRYKALGVGRKKTWDSCSPERRREIGMKATKTWRNFNINATAERKRARYVKVANSLKRYYSYYEVEKHDVKLEKLSSKLGFEIYDLNNRHKNYLCKINNCQYLFKSKVEIEIAKYLLDKFHYISYEEKHISYYYENQQHLYIPDFFIKEYNLLIEIKGNYYINDKDTYKWDAARKEYDLIVVYYDKIDIMLNQIENYLNNKKSEINI